MILTNEQVDRFIDGIRSSVKWRELNEKQRLKWLVRLVEKRCLDEMKIQWWNEQSPTNLSSISVCAYNKNGQLVHSNSIKKDDPASDFWNHWMKPDNHPPEDEWGL